MKDDRTTNDEVLNEDVTPSPGSKKEYTTPTVRVHGTVADITKATGPFAPDGIIGFSIISDRAAKQDFQPVDVRQVLSQLVSIPVETWSYKTEAGSVRHIGPMAQDFSKAFGLGETDRMINTIDANGVNVAAIQALYGMVQDRDREIETLKAEIRDIKTRLAN